MTPETADSIAAEICEALNLDEEGELLAKTSVNVPPIFRREPIEQFLGRDKKWMLQQKRMNAAHPCLREHLDKCLKICGLDRGVLDMRHRGPTEYVLGELRQTTADNRSRLWFRMRQTQMKGGNVPSYPEIANACGLLGHSTIVESVQKWERRLRAACDAAIAGEGEK